MQKCDQSFLFRTKTPSKVKKLSKFKPNPDNPRRITGPEFEKLKKNVHEFEKMLELRPIIADKSNVIIGGNNKFRALLALGYTEVPDNWITIARDLTEEERRRFIMLDNHHAGTDDWDIIMNQWDTIELVEWGIDIPGVDPPGGSNVNFNATPPSGLKVKATCQNADQVKQITDLMDSIGVEYKIR